MKNSISQPIKPFGSVYFPLKKICNEIPLHSPITGELYSITNPATCDHIVARAKGGNAYFTNIWVIDEKSNLRRGKQRLDKFLLKEIKHDKMVINNLRFSFNELIDYDRDYVKRTVPVIEHFIGKRLNVYV